MVNEQDEEKDTNADNGANHNADRGSGSSNNGDQGTTRTKGPQPQITGQWGRRWEQWKRETTAGPENHREGDEQMEGDQGRRWQDHENSGANDHEEGNGRNGATDTSKGQVLQMAMAGTERPERRPPGGRPGDQGDTKRQRGTTGKRGQRQPRGKGRQQRQTTKAGGKAGGETRPAGRDDNDDWEDNEDEDEDDDDDDDEDDDEDDDKDEDDDEDEDEGNPQGEEGNDGDANQMVGEWQRRQQG